jgi:hypothetical protein
MISSNADTALRGGINPDTELQNRSEEKRREEKEDEEHLFHNTTRHEKQESLSAHTGH